MFVIFDLDGTLADITHRLSYIDREACKARGERPNWDAFHHACVYDRPIKEMIALNQVLWLAGHRVEIWSGRSDMVYDQTVAWLQEHGVRYHQLVMRMKGDHQPDNQLKESWLNTLLDLGTKPDIVFDDRSRIVEMWRSHGIRCAQVAPGNF